jgi:ABC-type phosphate transport system substrate-binding protein
MIAMKMKLRFVLAIAILLLPAVSHAATVVVNSEVDASKLNADTLELMFLGKKTLWDSGQRVTPALLNEDSAVSVQFLENVLSKSVSQYRAYWKRRLFSGGGTVPKTFRTSNEVIDFVARTPGAIGVVESGVKDSRVTVVNVSR